MKTSVPDFQRILTGHFRRGLNYQGYRSQGSADWLLIYTLAGEGRITRNRQSIYCRAGELLLCQPRTPHDYCSSPRGRGWEIVWAHFHPRAEWLDWIQWPEILPGWHHLRLDKADRIARRLLEMHRRAFHLTRDPHGEALSMNALEEALLWADAAHEGTRQRADQQTRAAIHFLAQHHDRPVNLERLAQASGQSVARLTREFRRHTGMSVRVYLEKLRLDRARQLLARTTLRVKEISAQTGFQNPFYFSQRFKRKTGKNPRAYRQWASG